MEEKITFYLKDTGEEVSFFVIEDTTIHNVHYLLVSESMEEDSEAYILKELENEGNEGEETTLYEMVEDEQELRLTGKIFEELLDDIEFEW